MKLSLNILLICLISFAQLYGEKSNYQPINGTWARKTYIKYGKYLPMGKESETLAINFRRNLKFTETYSFHGLIKNRMGKYKVYPTQSGTKMVMIYKNGVKVTFAFNIEKNTLWIAGVKYIKQPQLEGKWSSLSDKPGNFKLQINNDKTFVLFNTRIRHKGKWLFSHTKNHKKILTLNYNKGYIKQFVVIKINKKYVLKTIGKKIIYKKYK